MSKLWVPLVVLALIVAAIPGFAQDEKAAEALDVIDKFGEATTKMMKQQETEFDFANALLMPEDQQTQTRIRSAMLLLQMTLAVAPTPDNVTEMSGDGAVVTLNPEPVPFVMREVDGQWKIDLEATVDRLPKKARAAVEPTEQQMAQEQQRAKAATCYNNLGYLAQAALMYARDHDRTLPDADKWTDQLMEYVDNERLLKCPAAEDAQYAYAMNEELSGMTVDDIASMEHTVLFFESTLDTRNAAGSESSIVTPPRHSMGNGFAFADGHVEFLQDTPNFDPAAEAPEQETAPQRAPQPAPAQ